MTDPSIYRIRFTQALNNSHVMRRVIRTWWQRFRPDRRLHTPSQAGQVAEHQAAKRRLLEEAERQRGRAEGRHRWYDGPTRLIPLLYHRTPLLTYGQQCGYRISRG